VCLTNRNEIIAYILGEGHNLQEHYVVMVRGGRVKDLLGVKYHCIQGIKDLQGIPGQRQGRSKYGKKNPKILYEFICQIIEFQLCFWFIPRLLSLIKTFKRGENEKNENWPSFWPFSSEYIMEGSFTRQFLAKALVSKESSKVFLLYQYFFFLATPHFSCQSL
jgi:hypothetical protein